MKTKSIPRQKNKRAKTARPKAGLLTKADWDEAGQELNEQIRATADADSSLLGAVSIHCDGHLAILGLNGEPMFVVMLALGPVDAESLFAYFQSRVEDFVGLDIIGSIEDELPWCVVGSLPATEQLDEAERESLEEEIEPFVMDLTERFFAAQTNN